MPVSETILPVLIGADMNCYTLARAFHEAYGVRFLRLWPLGHGRYHVFPPGAASPPCRTSTARTHCWRTVTRFRRRTRGQNAHRHGLYRRLRQPAHGRPGRAARELHRALHHAGAAGQAGFQGGFLRSVRQVSASPTRKPSAPKAPWTPPPCRAEALGFAYPVIVEALQQHFVLEAPLRRHEESVYRRHAGGGLGHSRANLRRGLPGHCHFAGHEFPATTASCMC